MSYIAKFNPYSMDNETILAVATGRRLLLSQVLGTLKDNFESSSASQHMIIKGPRGMGKSFFLKYLKINFQQEKQFKNCDFLLLPEEQNNINSPSDLIKLILNQLKGKTGEDITSLWEEPDEIWQIELNKLKEYIHNKKEIDKGYMLVVVIENLNDFLTNIQNDKKTRKVYESRFRHLLEKINNLTIIGATPAINSNIDSNYKSRIFHAFKKFKLRPWTEEDYFKYFDRRKEVKIEEGEHYSKEQSVLMKAKLKALSKFTGGSPRMAVVLTNLLLEDDVISTVKTLFGLIDDLTPYYQDLTSHIPSKSRILFDTLIRKGENLSQSEVARIVGATQSQIAKAFLWLKDNGYIIGKRRTNSPAFSYQVTDRIHVLYYQFREIHHNQNITPIWLLSDFLVSFYQEKELFNYANRYLTEQPNREANDLAKIYLLASGRYKKEELPDYDKSEECLAFIKHLPEKEKKEVLNSTKTRTPIEAIAYYKEKYKESISNGNTSLEAFYLGYIGWNYTKLKEYKKAIEFHQKALKLSEKDKNISEQALNLGMIGWNYKELKEYKKAIEFHQKALKLSEKDKNISEQALNLGHIGENYILLNQWDNAIKLLNPNFKMNEVIFKEFGDAIIFTEKHKSISKAFNIGVRLLHLLEERKDWLPVNRSISKLSAGLLNMHISSSLFIDLCEEAKTIFTKADTLLIIDAGLHTMKYIESDKDPSYLEQLNPDMAIAIKVIIDESKL